ncbi:hypothetical protein AB0K15_44570 [Amycolatopsis sp. NPDC049253]|uniref:hypothetical protein n=1 Tax=Amycolatopsis sp. NPDC049253 TaxID=3155274 RepID=UPI00342CE645
MGDFNVGMSLAAVLEAVGDPDATTGPLPAIYAYGDIQLGISQREILWYIAIESSGSDVVIPGPCGARCMVQNFTRSEFMNVAQSSGRMAVKSEPFVSDEYWWNISGSGVFVEFDEDGLMAAAHYSDRALAG